VTAQRFTAEAQRSQRKDILLQRHFFISVLPEKGRSLRTLRLCGEIIF
jgi:hypothetical protein